jgi:hypothetical protein
MVDLLPAQVLGGAELVEADRVHAGDRRSSSALEVKRLRAGARRGMLGPVAHRLDTSLLQLGLLAELRGVRVAG